MNTEAQVRDLLLIMYRDIGGEISDIDRVMPSYGGWHNTLKYFVVRKDGGRAAVWRRDVDEANYDEIRNALRSFSPALVDLTRSSYRRARLR
jgi:hypothetical protein